MTPSPRLRCAAVLFGSALLLPRAAVAGPDASSRDEALYAEARAAFDAGDYAKACPLFEEFHHLTAIPAALFTLAECEARWGKPARAFTHYEEFLRKTKDAPPSAVQEQRVRVANEQLERLSLQVGRVEPVVGPSVKGSVLVKVDGKAVPIPVPEAVVVEPGEHTVELVSESGAREERKVLVGPGDRRRVELGVRATPPPQPDQAAQRKSDGGFTTPVWIAGGIGIAGLATSGVFGALALAKKSDVDAGCVDRVCTVEGKDAADSLQSYGTVSTIAFAVGAAGIVTALVLHFVVSPSGGTAKPIALGPAGLVGRF